MHWIVLAGLVCWFACASCAGPVVKPDALDPRLLRELRAGGELVPDELGEHRVRLDATRWMRVAPAGPLTFVGLRDDPGSVSYELVVECDPERDLLSTLPLAAGEGPLDVLSRPDRRAELEAALEQGDDGTIRNSSLREAIAERRFAPPLPIPSRIVATAANFESHLLHDLDVGRDQIARYRETPARVFQKHPPLDAPGSDPRPEPPFRGVIGPFDTIVYPNVVSLPDDEHGVTHVVPTNLDYEVEIGFVVGRALTWTQVAAMTDDELWSCVAGYLLVSDVKARNPQVFERILARGHTPTEPERRYLTGEAHIDEVIGRWDEETCDWWGYAASQGNYAGLGPFFVAAEGFGRPGGASPTQRFPDRAVGCARSYAPEVVRGVAPPKGRRPGELYLRQLSPVTVVSGRAGSLLWDPPAILRAILRPTSALRLASDERRIEAGDVVALGTPGGIVLTVDRGRMYSLLDSVLFWWDAIDWHNAFFRRDRANYLQQGDEVFLWADGLGCQHGVIARLDLPPLPEQVEQAQVPAVEAKAEIRAEAVGLDERVEAHQTEGERAMSEPNDPPRP